MNLVTQETCSIFEHFDLGKADRLVVTFFPKGKGRGESTEYVVVDAKVINLLLDPLRSVPSNGPGLMMKLADDAPEIHIEFFNGEISLGVVRLKAGKLSAPADTGWSFYVKEDAAFKAQLAAVGREAGWEIEL